METLLNPSKNEGQKSVIVHDFLVFAMKQSHDKYRSTLLSLSLSVGFALNMVSMHSQYF